MKRVIRMARVSEIAADDWRTREFLLERALLRLKRERRSKSNFIERTGDCRVFPSIGWKSSTQDASESIFIAADPSMTTSTSEKSGDSSSVKTHPVVWIRARIDPDWGLRLNLIQLRIKSGNHIGSSTAIIERIFVSNSLPITSSSSSSSSKQRTSVQGLLTPAKQQINHQSSEMNGKTKEEEEEGNNKNRKQEQECVIDLQRHSSLVVSQIGEDCYFYLGFQFANVNEQEARAWALNIHEIIIRFEDDIQVSKRIQQEVDQVGPFDLQYKREWEKLNLEVLG